MIALFEQYPLAAWTLFGLGLLFGFWMGFFGAAVLAMGREPS